MLFWIVGSAEFYSLIWGAFGHTILSNFEKQGNVTYVPNRVRLFFQFLTLLASLIVDLDVYA